MNITRSQIKTQYERAKSRGWIPFFQEASNTITKGFFDPADLMGIGSRESNLDPKWLTKAGDHGNGFGLMQADKRSFPQFTKGDAWKDAKTGILFGAKVLMQKWHDVQSGVGLKRGVTSSKTKKISYYIGKDVGQGAEAQAVAIASYNAGRWPAYAVANGKHPDTYTTGKDYSADVIARAKVFRELLAQDFPSSAANLPESSESALEPTVDRPESATTAADNTPPGINIENVENAKIDNKPPPQSEPVTVSIERVSVWAKIGAAFAGLSGIGISMGEVVTGKLNGLDPMHFLYVIGGVLLIALALYFYDKDKKRAHEKTLEKMKSAADPAKNTVELTRTK